MSSSPDAPAAPNPSTDALAATSSNARETLADSDASVVVAAPSAAAPSIPPRTYPRPPPSSLVPMLLGLARVLKYTAVGSALMLFVYFTYVLPRLNLVTELRAAMHKHHAKFLLQLQGRLLELKATREVVAPAAVPFAGLEAVAKQETAANDAAESPVALSYERSIRSVLLDRPDGLPFEELMAQLETKFKWMSQRPRHYRAIVLETLERGAHFDVKVEENAARVLLKDSAAQHAEKPTREVADLRVLKGLVEMLKRQHPPGDTLHSVVQLTSYISSQTYALVTPYTSFRAAGVQGSASLNPAEDEIRREIRSLKSLLLNRRSFVLPRTGMRTASPCGA